MAQRRTHAQHGDFHAKQFFMAVLLLAFALAIILLIMRVEGSLLLTRLPSTVPQHSSDASSLQHTGTVDRAAGMLAGTVHVGAIGTIRISHNGFMGFGDELAAIPVDAQGGAVPFAWVIPEALNDGGAHLLYVELEYSQTGTAAPLDGSPVVLNPGWGG